MTEDEDVAHVHFSADFDYHPTPRATIAYKAGWSGPVKRDCAAQAKLAGKAEEIAPPPSPNSAATAGTWAMNHDRQGDEPATILVPDQPDVDADALGG